MPAYFRRYTYPAMRKMSYVRKNDMKIVFTLWL